MESRIKNIIIIILILVGTFLLGYIIILKNNLDTPEPICLIQRDTLIINRIDTIKVEKIKYKERTILDTIYIKDTILVKEQLHYQDSLIDLYISGIDPKIDSMIHFIKKDTILVNTNIEKTIILKDKQRKFHIALTAGYYAGYDLINKGFYTGPGGGISITYDIW